MKITLVGSGPKGLATALVLARKHAVTLLVSDPEQAAQINRGEPPLDELLATTYLYANRHRLQLSATTDANNALRDAELIIVDEAHHLPSSTSERERLAANSQLADAVLCIALPLNLGAWFVLQAPVPLGFTAALRRQHATPNIVFAPSFARPSRALQDSLRPERIVVGACTALARLYAEMRRASIATPPFADTPDTTVLLTGSREAEAVGLLWPTNPAPEPQRLQQAISFAQTHGLSTRDLIEGLGLKEGLPVLQVPVDEVPAPQEHTVQPVMA